MSDYPSLRRWVRELAETTTVWLVLPHIPDGTPMLPIDQVPGKQLYIDFEEPPSPAVWLTLLASPYLHVGAVASSDKSMAVAADQLPAEFIPPLINEVIQQWQPRSASLPAGRASRFRRHTVASAQASAMPLSRRALMFGVNEPEASQLALLQAIWEQRRSDGPVEAPAIALSASSCTACGTCVRICPAEALELQSGTGQELLLDGTSCIGCRQCIHYCPASALSASGGLTFNEIFSTPQPQILVRMLSARCKRCGSVFGFPVDDNETGAAPEFCPVCTARMASPFGSVLPGGLRR